MKFFLLLSLLIFTNHLQAQEFPFTLSVSESSYQQLTESTILFEKIKKDTALEVNLPFDFPFFGETVSTIYVTPFGSIGTHTFEDDNGWLTDGNMLYAGQVKYDSVELVSYKIEADIVKIEWKNAAQYNAHGGGSGALNFQIWIYKNGQIDFRYGYINIGFVENFEDLQIGIGKNVFENNCDFQSYWALQGDVNQSQIMTLCSFRLLDELPLFNPSSNHLYTFSPIENFKDNSHELPYDFKVTTGIYKDLQNSIYLLDNPTKDTTVKITLPFEFELLGNKYIDFFVSTDGFFMTTDHYEYENSHIIFPLFLEKLRIIPTSLSYEISGSVNNRIYKLQWKNLHSQRENHEDEFANVQLWLFEKNGTIEFHYGALNLDIDTNVDIGIIHDISDIDDEPVIQNIWMLQKLAMTPTIIRTCNLEFLDVTTADIPLENLIYHFGGHQTNSVPEINNNTIQILPNITSDLVQIQSRGKINQIQVVNVNGQLIFNQKNIDKNIVEIDLSNVCQGMYFVHVISELEDFVGKVVRIN